MSNKVLIIGGSFSKKGGIESLSHSIYHSIDSSRNEVTLLGLYDGYYKSSIDSKILKPFISNFLKIKTIPVSFKTLYWKLFGAYNIQIQKFDTVIFNHIRLWNLYDIKGIKKTIIWFHGREIWDMQKENIIKKPNFEAVSVSHFTDQKIRPIFSGLKEYHIINPPVDTDFFKPSNLVTNNNRNILFVGRLNKSVEYKGLGLLLKTISKLREKGRDIGLTVIGEGDYSKYYQDLAIRLGIEKVVQFKKNLTKMELLNEYQKCLCFAMPSMGNGYNAGEGFGIVFIEAQACGKIVITGQGGGSGDAIIKDVTGFSVNNIDELTKTVDTIYDLICYQSDTSRSRICRDFVVDNFSIKQFSTKINNII